MPASSETRWTYLPRILGLVLCSLFLLNGCGGQQDTGAVDTATADQLQQTLDDEYAQREAESSNPPAAR